jgi:phage terminase small subunit
MTIEVKTATTTRKPKGGSKPNRRQAPNGSLAGVVGTTLTIEQEAYCRGRAMGMSIEEALLACNSKVKPITAKTKWEKLPAFRDRIAELSRIATENAILKTGLDREWVISRLMQVVDRCMQAEPVLVKGEPTGEFKFDASGANAALKMLGDTMGLFKPQEEKHDEFSNLSDADLARIAADLAAESGLLAYIAGTEA